MSVIPAQVQGIVLGINGSFALACLEEMHAKLLAAGSGKEKQRQVIEVEIAYLERNIDELGEIYQAEHALNLWLNG